MGDAVGFAPVHSRVDISVGGQAVKHVLSGEKGRETVDGSGIFGQLPQVGLSVDRNGQKTGYPRCHKASAHNGGSTPPESTDAEASGSSPLSI
jgi:hypothetical protein